MRLFNTAAIIAIAGAALMAQAPQSVAERFQASQPEIERLLAANNFKDAVQTIEAILPASVPDFVVDPEDPEAGMKSSEEMTAIQFLYNYLGRATLMAGDTEKAISSFQKAEQIANVHAEKIEDIMAPFLGYWTAIGPRLEHNIEQIETLKPQIEKLKEEQTALEGKRRRNKAENDRLAVIQANIANFEEYLASVPVWQAELERVPLVTKQINDTISDIKESPARFPAVIEGIKQDLDSENEQLASDAFKGDKAKYVDSVINTKANLDSLAGMGKLDQIKFLNRLLFLDSQNKTVQQKLDEVLAK
jgi:predicted  nucleic acid-binding Zn-ribbon protein